MPGERPSKKDQLLRLLQRGSVFVHLDPRREEVIVPEWLANRPQLVLQLGLNFQIPIPDLVVDDYGVRCTLSFNRSPFHCSIPWHAVYALVDDDGQVNLWHEELPTELAPQPAAVRKSAPTPRTERPRSVRPKISIVPAPVEANIPTPSPTAPVPVSIPAPAPAPVPSLAPASGVTETPAQEPPSESDEINEDQPSRRPSRERPAWLRVVK